VRQKSRVGLVVGIYRRSLEPGRFSRGGCSYSVISSLKLVPNANASAN
jgi:hypothetical protein